MFLVHVDNTQTVIVLFAMQVRCLVDVPGEKLPSVASGALATYLETQVAPQVPEQLREAFVTAIHDGRLRSMLNKQMTLTPLHR